MAPSRPLAAVTGASSGIGATFADKLAQRGHDLLLIARRADRLEEKAREWRSKHGVAVEVFAADLADDAGIGAVAQRIEAEPRLAVLVNNAGFGTRGFFVNTPFEGQEKMHRLHVIATLKLTHAALPGMVQRHSGSIVNVSSVAGFTQGMQNVSYCATKNWMNSFTYGLYLELQAMRSPVRVQALCPGFTITEFHDVLGVDRSKIRMHWMTSDYVVEHSLRALEDNRPIVVPNWRYRFVAEVVPRLPLWLKTWALSRYGSTSRPE